MMYVLRLKNSLDRVDGLQASTIEEARELFIARKQMGEDFFDQQYVVTEWTQKDILETADNLDTPKRRRRMKERVKRGQQIKKDLFKKKRGY